MDALGPPLSQCVEFQLVPAITEPERGHRLEFCRGWPYRRMQ